MFEERRHLKRNVRVNALVLNVLNCTQCPEHPQSCSSTLSVENDPTTLALAVAIFMFVLIATLIIIIRI